MKVVISGYYGFDNIGDDAILLSIIQSLKEYDSRLMITVLSNNPEKTIEQYQVHSVNRWSMKEVFQEIKTADGLISGGGSLMQDVTGKKSIIYYTGVIRIAKFLKVPVFIYAQGMGPFNSSFSKWLVKNTLKKTAITVRDHESKELLKSIGVEHEIEIVPDPVLALKIIPHDSPWWKEQEFSGPVLTVSVRHWPSAVSYKEKIAAALDRIAAKGIRIVFVPMHGKYDAEASAELAKLMKEKSVTAPYDASIEEKISIIMHSDLLFGMRLHALIFAAISNTPFVALSYDPKVDSFAGIMEQKIAGHVSENNWTAESLYEQLSMQLSSLTIEKQKLYRIMGPLQKQAHETAAKSLTYMGSDSGYFVETQN